MGNFGKIALGALGGFIACTVMLGRDVDKGDVVYENDDIYVKADKSKSYGWSWARVNYKHPTEE